MIEEAGELSYGDLFARASAASGDLPPVLPVSRPAGRTFAVQLQAAWLAGSAIAPIAPGTPSPPRTVPDGTLAVLQTSGTTGEPRAICLSRANFEASARASAALVPVEPEDRWLCCLPVHHVAGLSIFTRCAIYGATVLVVPWEASDVRGALEAGEATVVSLVPTQLARLRDAGLERAPRLRALLLGGGPIPDELFEWARDTGLPVMPTYGMTETTSQIATAAPGERLGRVLPGVELRISDDGEILVRGPMVAAEGWLHTGDRGRLTAEGLLEVEGRMDDLIVTGGENVAAREVEEVLRAHPRVADAAVLGIDDREWGKAVTGFVAGDATEDELIAHCRERLARFKVPKRIYVLDSLPRTAAGKLLRSRLTEGREERA